MPILSTLFLNTLPVGEQELKFHVPGQAVAGMRRWLDRAFRPHRNHPVTTICSIYFDSPDRMSFREKEASDYRKTKYRIRWYADASGVPADTPAYMEIKEKHGAARRKYRIPLPMPAAELAATSLTDSLFSRIFQRSTTPGVPLPVVEIRPVLELRYDRYRYSHPVFPETFCLDAEIRCVRTHPASLPQAHGRPLDHAVFEQKGQAVQPLPVLQALPRFGVRKAAISKFFLAVLQLKPDSEAT